MSVDPLDCFSPTETSSEMEDELRKLKEKNTALVNKVQYWKMLAAQRENEKLDLMKEINDLRLQLGRFRSEGADAAHVLNVSLQSSIEEALSHLVQSSSAMAKTLEVVKTYIRKRQELEDKPPRWSSLSTPNRVSERVNRVRPMLVGGRSIQPVVLLSHPTDSQLGGRTSVQTANTSSRVLPTHMLQDLYIPLQRINSADYNQSAQENENRIEEALETTDSPDAGRINEDVEHTEDTSNMVEDEFETSRRLTAVVNEQETGGGSRRTNRNRFDDPFQGPSYLVTPVPRSSNIGNARLNEPDSTTEPDEALRGSAVASSARAVEDAELHQHNLQGRPETVSREAFTPTVRRRKRPSSPAPVLAPSPSPSPSPLPAASLSPTLPTSALPAASRPTRPSEECRNNGRILKVMIPKMRLEGAVHLRAHSSASSDSTPPKRLAPSFDAPSPNGATDNAVIVMEERSNSSVQSQDGNGDGNCSGSERDASAGGAPGGERRTRRPRKQITYKEKPLNMKLRR